MSQTLQDMIAVTTGIGYSGPGWEAGKAIAVKFARKGARVLGFDKSATAAAEIQSLIREAGGECAPFTADASLDTGGRLNWPALIKLTTPRGLV